MEKAFIVVKVVFAVTALIGLSIMVLSHYRARASIGSCFFDIAPAETPAPRRHEQRESSMTLPRSRSKRKRLARAAAVESERAPGGSQRRGVPARGVATGCGRVAR
jgi:hypothetical protein